MTTPNNLPAELSSFVGRERQMAELRRLMRKCRLITLTGPGGAGKTRLALRLAADRLDRYPGGVWLVELAALDDARLLEQVVATACGVREKGRRPVVQALVKFLAGRRALVVLDGSEHLVDACAQLASRLLRSCPELTLLTTSREPLGVAGELIWRTPSLTVPRLEDAKQPELIMESEAVRLFVERAQLSRPGFSLDRHESAAVAQICTRLEGMPLAIELAASLAHVMSVQEILDRLHDRFRLLTGGNRSALPRHQTLRHAVDWSYGLLSPTEGELLRRLAVFAGGFDLAGAEAVASGAQLGPDGVLPIVSQLVRKSLIAAEPAGPTGTRYRMLDTIREYALEKLSQGDEGAVRRLHARYFVDMVDNAARHLSSHDPLPWLRRFDEEQANLRLALSWCLAEQPDDGLRMAAALGRYWQVRCHFAESLEWLDQALALTTSNLAARAAALLARARIKWRQGVPAGARNDAAECVQLSRELGLMEELTGALSVLGILTSRSGDWVEAAHYHEEALEVARRLGNPGRIATSLNNLALGVSALGDNEAARGLLEEAVDMSRQSADPYRTAILLDSLARVNLRLRVYSTARGHYLEALAMSAELEDAQNVAVCLEGLGLIALNESDYARTIRLMAAANGLRVLVGDEPTPDWRNEVGEGLATARAKLGARAADAAWREGDAFGMAAAVNDALRLAAPARDGGSPLSAREMEVARLISDGLTNGEVAGRLRIAARTVDAHVEHIRNKLGLRTRAQIAVWAHERLGKA